MQAVEQIIHARWIITNALPNNVLAHHSLIVDQGTIKDILPTDAVAGRYVSANVLDYPEHALMPGLINAHTHIGMNFFRGLGSDHALMDWLTQYMWPAEKRWLDHEFVRDASLFAMAEMIRSGTTCFNDMFYFLEATAEAADIAGLRAFIGISVLDFPTNWAQSVDEYFAKGIDFYHQYKDHPRITTTLAPHAPYTVSNETFIRVKQIAEDLNLKINLHLHETQDEINQSLQAFDKRPIKRLQELDILSPQLLAVHSCVLNEEDLDILQMTRPQIIHCPESNMKLASGICPVVQLQARDMNVALGTDSVASNNDLDMITEMRTASLLAKISNQNCLKLKAEDTLKLATVNGAKALGIETLVGSLIQGMAADFIAIDLNQIETLPVYDPVVQIVYSSARQNVSDVWVAGKQLMKNRQLLTLDEERLKRQAQAWGEKIQTNLGF